MDTNHILVEGNDPNEMHKKMAETIRWSNRNKKNQYKVKKWWTPPIYPMIILKTPKGWTGPKMVDGKQIEGTFRAHQVPLDVSPAHPENLEILENGWKVIHPEELFDENGTLKQELKELLPKGDKRMGANPNTNGGLLN